MVVGGELAARMGKMNKEVEGDLLDNRLLDVQRHETHHVGVGRRLKVVLILDSLGERLAFAVGKEKEWRSASLGRFFGLNCIFSVLVQANSDWKTNHQNRRVRNSLPIWS